MALGAVMAEWTRTNLGYEDRIAHLTGAVGGGLNGTVLLTSSTVFGDMGSVDTLWGRGGLDWFFASLEDSLRDRLPGEVVTAIV
jgi:hypothetical protein